MAFTVVDLSPPRRDGPEGGETALMYSRCRPACATRGTTRTPRGSDDRSTQRPSLAVIIRRLTRDDGPALWSFHRAQLRRVRRGDPQPWEAELAGLTGNLLKLLRAGWCHIDGGFDDQGRLVAVFAWRVWRPDLASAELLTVRSDCYRSGYGQQMADHLVTSARAIGVRQIVATVHEDNAAALRLLEGVNAVARPEEGPVPPGYCAYVIECARVGLRRD